MHRLLGFLLLALALPAAAQIYKYTDANGNTVYTNQPPNNVQSEKISVQQPNTVQVAPSKPLESSTNDQTEQAPPYEVLQLSGLPDDEALRANNGTFSVTVESTPPLASGHRVRLLLDGQPYGEPSTSTQLQLVNIDRGEHSLAVEVIDIAGQALQQSEAVTFTLQRVNMNSPALRPQPTPPKAP